MSATSLTPPSTGLSGTQFSTLYSVGINDPEGPENITTLKSHFTMPTAILSVSNLVIHFSIIDLPFYSKAFVA
jgi:hypothetical protein